MSNNSKPIPFLREMTSEELERLKQASRKLSDYFQQYTTTSESRYRNNLSKLELALADRSIQEMDYKILELDSSGMVHLRGLWIHPRNLAVDRKNLLEKVLKKERYRENIQKTFINCVEKVHAFFMIITNDIGTVARKAMVGVYACLNYIGKKLGLNKRQANQLNAVLEEAQGRQFYNPNLGVAQEFESLAIGDLSHGGSASGAGGIKRSKSDSNLSTKNPKRLNRSGSWGEKASTNRHSFDGRSRG